MLLQVATLRKCQGYHTSGSIDLEVIRFVRTMAAIKETALLGATKIPNWALVTINDPRSPVE